MNGTLLVTRRGHYVGNGHWNETLCSCNTSLSIVKMTCNDKYVINGSVF